MLKTRNEEDRVSRFDTLTTSDAVLGVNNRVPSGCGGIRSSAAFELLDVLGLIRHRRSALHLTGLRSQRDRAGILLGTLSMMPAFLKKTTVAAFGILACSFISTPSATAEEPAKARKALYESGAAAGKSGYVDMAALLNGHKKSEGVIQALQDEAAKKGLLRGEHLKQIEELSQGGAERELQAKRGELEAYDREAMAFLDQKQQELFAPVFQDIEASIQKYGAENQYAFIYPEPHPDAADLTQEILQRLR